MTIRGLNHITLAVKDLPRSVNFYQDILGFRLRALWSDGAYLEAGELWLCLSRDDAVTKPVYADYTHIAFDVAAEDFETFAQQVEDNAEIWKPNKSEGASLYFLDPDGHRLELHSGSLASRLAHYRQKSDPDFKIF